MKNKIMLLAGILLLSSAAWVWAEVPQKISFVGKTFVFSQSKKSENGEITYEAEAGNITFSIFEKAPGKTYDPVAEANKYLQLCEEDQAKLKRCQLEYCNNSDVVVSYSISHSSQLPPLVRILRFTETKAVLIIIPFNDSIPVSQARRALCQLEI